MPSSRDPFANFDRMRRQIDELFGDVWSRAGLAPNRRAFTPRVDVYYYGDPSVQRRVAGSGSVRRLGAAPG